jgi:predicted MFS family arabinose efflux permease
MGGILIGILLARTVSGVLGAHLGWRTVYFLAGGIMIGLAATLRFCLPRSRPEKTLAYPALLRSLWPIARQEPVLREAALVGAAGFGAFSVFWTTLVFWLEGPAFGLGSQAAGLFGLFGVAGALAASLGGRLTDRYSRKAISAAALVLGLLSFGLLAIAGRSLVGLGAGVVLLDLGVQLNHVANLARVHALAPEARSRLNTLYMVTYFFGGAAGTGLGAWAWSRHGWPGVCAAGALFCLAGLARLAGAPRRHSGRCVPERSAP